MASLGEDQALYMYSPELEDDVYQQNIMLTHPTNLLKLDEVSNTPGSADNRVETAEKYDHEDDDMEDSAELSPGGILDEETVARGLDNFGRNADGTKHVYLDCTVAGFNLEDITLLAQYEHVQKVDVSYNELTDISALSALHHMIELNCSHNKLTECLALNPPAKNLRYADFSFNNISNIPDLSAYGCLEHLNLDNNQITEMTGISNCKRLKSLNLAHNKVTKMQGMTDLNIRHLCLKYNELTSIENLETLEYLQSIDLSGNKIRSLLGLQRHNLLESIDMEYNEVIDISEIKFVRDLNMLSNLNLLRNPINELPDYRLLILYRVPKLKELDRRKVDAREKISATNLFEPSMEVIAQRDHIMHVVYSFLQPKRVFESTLPSVETPYPMLVLVGPQGAGKKDLALKLVEEFSDYFGYGVCHTTRRRQPAEVHDRDYKFCSVDEFEELIKLGCFVETNMFAGNWYGLSIDSIESVASEGLATVVNMELEGVLTLKKTHFAPRYVLILPLSKEAHEKRLRQQQHFSDGHIQETLKRTDMYVNYNQDHPGFFDYMINSDDIGEAYKTLRQLIMEYLGMSIRQGEGSARSGSDRQSVGSGSCKEGSRPGTGNRIYSNMPNLHESNPKGSVMEASFLRRKDHAKEAVIGYIPSLYEQIVNKMPRTAPADLPTQMGLGNMRPPSRTVPETCPSSSTERSSSTEESESKSRMSNRTNTPVQPKAAAALPTETIDRLQLMSGTGSMQSRETSERPTSSRMGSAKFQVLPPIISPTPKPAGITS